MNVILKFIIKNLLSSGTLGLILLCPAWLSAQKYVGNPVTKPRLIKTIQSKQIALPEIVTLIKTNGVDFQLTAAVEQELSAVKTRSQIIDAVRANFRAPKGPTVVNKGGSAKGNAESSDEKYEQLYYQGLGLIDQLRSATNRQQALNIAQSMKDIGLRAIKLNPSRPDAYKVVGSAALLTGNFMEAEKYGNEAISRGGSLAFPVYHLSGTPHIEILYIGNGFITVESDQKLFQYNGREVAGVDLRENYNAPGGMVSVFRILAAKNNAPAEWFFSPANTGSAGESELIMRFIQKNSMARR
jgi:hypothetical protein